MTTVHVVTSGEYSDYGICGIFSTPELAQGYADVLGQDGVRPVNIDEWQLDEPDLVTAELKTTYQVVLDESGNELGNQEYRGGRKQGKAIAPAHSRGEGSVHGPFSVKPPSGRMFVGLSYISFDHALKLAAEARQQWLRQSAQAVEAVD